MAPMPFIQVPHGSGVDVPLLRSPLHLPAAPVEHRAPPTRGQHSAEVPQELLGKSEADIKRLRAAGVV
jgi:crotonobetainyl-CoA:carnitine CoA-transferase CaiB-like acyl-CoA transferase